MEPYLGQIAIFGFSHAPVGWAFCQGQLLPIADNTHLFSIIGTTYGGDGRSYFALPNLQGVPVGVGRGPGPAQMWEEPTDYKLGQAGGQAAVVLTPQQMPYHNHAFNVLTTQANSSSPAGNQLARSSKAQTTTDNVVSFYSSNPGNATTALAWNAIGISGSNQPHNNLQPYQALNFCIATRGVFPQPDTGSPAPQQPFLGELSICAFGKAPAGWALCEGQVLPIPQYQPLFSLLGTTYGGNGLNMFALPDLRGRVPLNIGANIYPGEIGGSEAHALSSVEMPAHYHPLMADAVSTSVGNTPSPATVLGRSVGAVVPGNTPFTASLYSAAAAGARLAGSSIGVTGGGESHSNMMPSLALNFCISLNGFFPARP